MLSVIIPSYKDPYLQNTLDSVLSQATGEIEVIVVLDGYWPKDYNWSDKRIRIVHLGKTRGMREAINAGVSVAKGEYLMRTDEHCMFGPGFDEIILNDIQDNEIVVPRRYFLDPVQWKVMDLPYVDYEKLIIDKTRTKFTAHKWRSRSEERKDFMVDETMAMQGSCWFMAKSWWEKVIVALQSEGYGTHYQDSTEMLFKTWKAGGRLMLNKNTWYAHKHRDFPRTHNYGGELANASFKYAIDTWGDYYQEVKKQWQI